MKTNKDKLVIQSVIGNIHSPNFPNSPYRISQDGVPMMVHATGGIVYNYKIGDNCMDLYGDHIEPGVSLKNPIEGENNALNFLSCIGNQARVISGEARGAKGYVTGSHGGIEHTLVHFDQEVLDKLAIDDRIQIKAYGQGLSIDGLDHIKIMNIDPGLFEKLGIEIYEDRLMIPVAAKIPAHLMGSGVGSSSLRGDYDIMTGDPGQVEKYGLDRLRFGDLVLLEDCDNSFGRQFLEGAVAIGVIIHSNSIVAGHGPGVTTIMTCKNKSIVGQIDDYANIAHYLGV